jgi:heptosyltransferase-3
LTAFCGAPDRAGFSHFRHQVLYNFPIPRAQQILGVDRPVHTAEHLASAMFYLGASGNIPRASLFESKDWTDRNAADSSFRHFFDAPYAVLHPFAATSEKTWLQAGFLAVAEHLKQSGLDPLFIGGPGDDLSPFQAFRTIPHPPLSETKQILARACLFVGNDSGPAHMAAAFGLPVVVIFGASDPAIWGPWQTASAVITSPNGIAHVEVSEVLGALTRLRVPA